MNRQHTSIMAAILSVVLIAPALTLAEGVQLRFGLKNPQTTPFPTNLFTVFDRTQNTRLRVKLPPPDGNEQPSDRKLTEIINTLDGFNLQPRLTLPFTDSIDLQTVTSETVFLINLGSALDRKDEDYGTITGINQVVWDPQTHTLYAESDELLNQHTRYALIVTRGIRDLEGEPIKTKAFKKFLWKLKRKPGLWAYRRALHKALVAVRKVGVRRRDIAAASVFTTQSITSFLEKARDQIKAATPEPAEFDLGFDGSRTVFPLEDLTHITITRQVGTDAFEVFLSIYRKDLESLLITPQAVSAIAFGSYQSSDYRTIICETDPPCIPRIATRTGIPQVFATNEVFFNLFLPAGNPPDNGWPVAIFGHGSGPGKDPDVFSSVAAILADSHIATIAINAVGFGGGEEGTMTVERTAGDTVTFLSGGRDVDLNGDEVIGFGTIGNNESFNEQAGHLQTALDIMQLVRVIQVGIDADDNGIQDLDPSRIYYVGQSLGSRYGMLFLATEPDVRLGVLNVPPGSEIEGNRLSPVNRINVAKLLAGHKPPLTNVGDASMCLGDIEEECEFDENLPLRNQLPVINDVPGAVAIQAYMDKAEWILQSQSSAVAYARHLRKKPLAGLLAKAVIIQFARGDQLVPNPSTTAILRAGELADRATFYRHDLVFNDPIIGEVTDDPHTFLALDSPLVESITIAAQQQIGEFFRLDGAAVIDPDGAKPFFEVPIAPPLPEDCGYVVEVPGFSACE